MAKSVLCGVVVHQMVAAALKRNSALISQQNEMNSSFNPLTPDETSEQQPSFTLCAQSWLGRAGESEAGGFNTQFVSLEVERTFF